MLLLFIILTAAKPLHAEENAEEVYMNRGWEYLDEGDFSKAIRAFRQVVKINPSSGNAYKGLGISYLKLGDNEVMTDPEMLTNAEKAFKEALVLSPDNAELRFNLGLTYLALSDKEAALREYEMLVKIDNNLADSLLARIDRFTSPRVYRRVGETAGRTLNVIIAGRQVLVPVTLIHGSNTLDALLLLDTGASMTMINADIASRLQMDLDKAPRTMGQVVGGGLIEARLANLQSLTVGPHEKSNLQLLVIEHKGPPVNFDGLLGMDILRDLKYHVDFGRGVIEFGSR